MRRIADGAREVGNVTRTTEINSDPGLGKSNLELESETRYPLLLPKAVVLKLKPVFSFCRNVCICNLNRIGETEAVVSPETLPYQTQPVSSLASALGRH